MADDVIEVDATPIDEGLSTLSKADKWLADAADRVTEYCKQYKPPKRIESAEQRKNCVRDRASVRKDAAAIDAERKAMLRDAEDALKRFKDNVKDILTPLTDLDVEYKRLLDEYEEQWRTERTIELTEEYEAIAPDLVGLVPFETILARFGMVKGNVWLNRTTNIVAAKQMLGEAIYTIADAERTIRESVPEEDVRDTLAEYFQTLDLQTALSNARKLRDQRERLAQLEAERAAREAQWEGRSQAEEPEPSPVAQPEPSPAAQRPPITDVPHPWVLVSSGATKAQMLQLRDMARSVGIPIDYAYGGTLQEVYERVILNA